MPCTNFTMCWTSSHPVVLGVGDRGRGLRSATSGHGEEDEEIGRSGDGRGDGWGDGREDGQLSHPPDPQIDDNTPARGGIVMYNGSGGWLSLANCFAHGCACFLRLVVMAAHGLRMVRPSKTGLRGHRLALPPIRFRGGGNPCFGCSI